MSKEEFLKDVENWSNHRILLWEALQDTRMSKYPVLELGCGDGSTPYLQQYCKDNNRQLVSFDSDVEWARKFGARQIGKDWDTQQWFYQRQYSVVLVDESPGEHRKEVLQLFRRYSIHYEIAVIHDSEPAGWNASDYQVRYEIEKFPYFIDLKADKPGAWASAVSHSYDVTKWKI